MVDNVQQLHASNRSVRLGEALEARVKDPLWFLARQWQTGEFEAESGGKPAQFALRTRDWLFDTISVNGDRAKLDRAGPLEAQVERESDDGESPAWSSEALEYVFEVEAGGHKFSAEGYDGRALDWYHFDYSGKSGTARSKVHDRRLTPTQLYFTGAPHSRWWQFEEGDAYYDGPVDPEPNALSLLLPEFFYVDIDNWYLVPLPMLSGSVHEIVRVTAIDSFGIVDVIGPATEKDNTDEFSLFALDGTGEQDEPLDGTLIFVPNIAADILHNDVIEEIRLVRDEQANLVWAWEQRIVDANGKSVATDTEMTGETDPGTEDNLPAFRLKSSTTRSWIPFVPRKAGAQSTISGEIYLRRGRTDEAASNTNPQYRSQVVSESVRINEEEVPPTGLRVRRIMRSARGSDGELHIWIGREKDAGQRTARPNLRFDYLDFQD